ncbi:hypothetical protein Ahy_B06g081087 [Arachis hypogaea]|uniref:Ubiquitin-like protease family profile domain-containing protein n=1 Tax=Arachis hypogaea TaxID=3818 RepID=A0A444YJZ7_ARAHY|nr:hypothetical protein Ahy_B06g081087 [Arachis hypogaea]
MPVTLYCMTPSPPSKKISLGNIRTEQNYTQYTLIKVHPLLKGQKLDEDDEERVRRWAANGSLEQSLVMASYEGRQHLSLVREDICSLLPRHWVTSNIVQWMCATFNDSESLRFKADFYCIPPGILETVLQKRNLDSFREIPTKRLWVLDSMNTGEHKNERLKIHAYAGRIIEDMVKVTMPAYEHTKNGLPHFYPSIPQQHNGCDCSVFVIKFIQFWSLDKPLQHWDKDVVQEFRKEIILDIVMGPHNSEIGKALEALDGKHVRRNQPRKKTKAVRSPFTAPSTKSMLQRAGLPTRKPNKGGRQRKKNF